MNHLFTYTTYVTTWGTDPYKQIENMISNSVVLSKTRIVLAFSNFDITSTEKIPGYDISIEET